MSQNVYECLFILDSNKYARDAARVSGSATEMVNKIEGEVLADRLWTEQKLAYPIQGHRKGTYWLTYFRADSEKLTDFNRLCQLNDAVLRHMVIRVEPRLVDVLVSHALGKSKRTQGESEQPQERSEASPAEPQTAEVVDAKSS